MSIVAGIDFGTQSVRVSIVDSERGRLGSGVATYPLHRRRERKTKQKERTNNESISHKKSK